MSFQMLSELLPKDIVDHCIVPYLGPSVESSKAQFAKVLEQLQTIDPWKGKTGIFFTSILGPAHVPDKIAEIMEQNGGGNDQDLLQRRYLLQSYPAELIDSLTPSAMEHLYIRVNGARERYVPATGTKLGNKLSQMMNDGAEKRMAIENNEDMEDDVLDYYTLDEYEGETEEDRREKAIEDAIRVRAIPIKVDRTPDCDETRLVCRMNAEGQVFCRRVKNYKGYSGVFCIEEDECRYYLNRLKVQKTIKKSDPKYKDLLYNDVVKKLPLRRYVDDTDSD